MVRGHSMSVNDLVTPEAPDSDSLATRRVQMRRVLAGLGSALDRCMLSLRCYTRGAPQMQLHDGRKMKWTSAISH
jgi:hypothetical protein